MRSVVVVAAMVAMALSAGCGPESADTGTRARNPTNTNPQGIAPSAEMGPAIRDMPGGGRGSATSTKGKQ